MTESTAPEKKSKAELEQLVKANGGKIYQTHNAAPHTICIAERSEYFMKHHVLFTKPFKGTVKVASMQKLGKQDVIRPSWLFESLKQNEKDVGRSKLLLPLEPRYSLYSLISHSAEADPS